MTERECQQSELWSERATRVREWAFVHSELRASERERVRVRVRMSVRVSVRERERERESESGCTNDQQIRENR